MSYLARISAQRLTLGPPEIQVITGLETWFTLPQERTMVPPPRYKMALITWLAIFLLIVGINILFEPFLSPLPMLLRSLILTVVLVLLMTYVVMPRMTQLFAPWLYPHSRRSLGKASRPGQKKR